MTTLHCRGKQGSSPHALLHKPRPGTIGVLEDAATARRQGSRQGSCWLLYVASHWPAPAGAPGAIFTHTKNIAIHAHVHIKTNSITELYYTYILNLNTLKPNTQLKILNMRSPWTWWLLPCQRSSSDQGSWMANHLFHTKLSHGKPVCFFHVGLPHEVGRCLPWLLTWAWAWALAGSKGTGATLALVMKTMTGPKVTFINLPC